MVSSTVGSSAMTGWKRRAGPNQGVQFIDRQDDDARRRLELRQYRLQAYLELAGILGARDQGAQVQHQQAFIFKTFGQITIDSACD